jgi:hypothetical protein
MDETQLQCPKLVQALFREVGHTRSIEEVVVSTTPETKELAR